MFFKHALGFVKKLEVRPLKQRFHYVMFKKDDKRTQRKMNLFILGVSVIWFVASYYFILQPKYTMPQVEVYQEDANKLIKKIEGDILYLDPPYNSRQYGANYHLLNTIAEYKPFSPKGKTGLRDYERSLYCSKNNVCDTFDDLLKNSDFKYIFLSYNNEGLMSNSTIRNIMERYGRYNLFETNHQRFKADKAENREYKAVSTIEYLHFLEKK